MLLNVRPAPQQGIFTWRGFGTKARGMISLNVFQEIPSLVNPHYGSLRAIKNLC